MLLCSDDHYHSFYKLQLQGSATEGVVRLGESLLNQDDENAFDYLTVFRELFCTCCERVIGKFYFSTTQQLHHLEKQYCLEKDAILQYCLGGNSSISQQLNGTEADSELKDVPTLIGLQQDVLKLQKLVVHLFSCYQQQQQQAK